LKSMISGPQNSRVKYLARLSKDGKLRQQYKHFLVEGPRFVNTAIDCGAAIEEVFFSPNLLGDSDPLIARCQAEGIELQPLSKECYRKIAGVKTPQGVAALVKLPEYSIEDICGREPLLLLLACGIQDPGNLGSMIRSAEAFGVNGVVVIRPAVDIYNSKVVRATAGNLFGIPVISCEEGLALEVLKSKKVSVLVADGGSEAAEDLGNCNWPAKCAVAIGSEARGVSAGIRSVAAGTFKIPMSGQAESLNAAAAAAVSLFMAKAKLSL
jgi:RNA methyltransferase, TrmH family